MLYIFQLDENNNLNCWNLLEKALPQKHNEKNTHIIPNKREKTYK